MLRWTKNVWKNGFFLDLLDELQIEVEDLTEENVESVRFSLPTGQWSAASPTVY